MLMAIKLGKLVKYLKGLPLLKLLDLSITWFCEITRHMKYFISPHALYQLPPSMAKW